MAEESPPVQQMPSSSGSMDPCASSATGGMSMASPHHSMSSPHGATPPQYLHYPTQLAGSPHGKSSPQHEALSRLSGPPSSFPHEHSGGGSGSGAGSPQYPQLHHAGGHHDEVLDSSDGFRSRSASNSPHHTLVHHPRDAKLHDNMPHHDVRSSPSHVANMSPSHHPNTPPFPTPHPSDITTASSPTMPPSCGKAAAASLSLPLNNVASSLGGGSANGSPRLSSTAPHVPSPLVASPRHNMAGAGNISNAASSPIYMPTEHRPMLIHSNVMDRSEGGGGAVPPRASRPSSHSIDSIMGNIPSGSLSSAGPPPQHTTVKGQEEQKATVSSTFMPSFNLHGASSHRYASSFHFSFLFNVFIPGLHRKLRDTRDAYLPSFSGLLRIH